jgi:myo-inositol-1(or 4)-monophosphatase
VRSGDDTAELPVDPGHGELLALARRAAAEAAEHVRTARPAGRVEVAATKSSATDPVTEIDTATEALIRRTITAVRPEDGFVGEEGGAQTGTSGVSWVLDPIDGTVNFVYGIPAYSVSIAVQVGDRVVAGVVRNVAAGEEFSAVLGGGAWLTVGDGQPQPLRVPELDELSQALVATGFGYDAERRVEQARALTGLIGRVRDVRRFGSAALDLCSVAAGRVDAYVEQGLNRWDQAAGVLVVREAGGVVTGLDGDEPDERLLVAASASLHARLHDAVVAAGY